MKGNRSNEIARERLMQMGETFPFEGSTLTARRMKKEIFDIISRYYKISPEDYEIKVVLKQNTGKSIRC
jgi:septum formation topological specificity factor MinE